MKLNQIIKTKRKELMMTQQDIANYLGITTPAVSKWEKGSSYPDITLLPPLARLLKIDLNTLLAFNENLSDDEIKKIIKIIEEKIENENYDTGFQYAISSINEFPTCVDLIFNVVSITSNIFSILEFRDEKKVISTPSIELFAIILILYHASKSFKTSFSGYTL